MLKDVSEGIGADVARHGYIHSREVVIGLHWLAGILTFLIVFLGITNIVRMAIFLLSATFYDVRRLRGGHEQSSYLPMVSIIIPAYNEGRNILACVASVLASDYPHDRVEVIVVNDGSTDGTEHVLREYMATAAPGAVKLVSQANAGKAHALNNGMRNHATGELVMCLDADSSIAEDAIRNAVRYFADEKVMALAAHVRIARKGGILNLVQVCEYIVSYQMKKALTILNIEYIIGGIGSMFRKAHLEAVGYYDTNTVTEDIDLSMKILRGGNKVVRVIYGSDVIAYTESVLRVSDLIKQRHRWKWGRFQTFLKNRKMFFSTDRRFTKALVWLYLPLALLYEITFLLEPIFLVFILSRIVRDSDYVTLLFTVIVISCYLSMNIVADDALTLREKIPLIVVAPVMYVLFYLLSFVEYMALLISLMNMRTLGTSLSKQTHTWTPVERLGTDRRRVTPLPQGGMEDGAIGGVGEPAFHATVEVMAAVAEIATTHMTKAGVSSATANTLLSDDQSAMRESDRRHRRLLSAWCRESGDAPGDLDLLPSHSIALTL